MKENIIIRDAVIDDIKEIQLMSLADELKNPNGEAQKEWWFESFVKEKQFFYVAVLDTRVVGFILAERTTGDCLLIQDIFVLESFRGMGIGKIFMDKVEEEARKRNYKLIYVYGDVLNGKTQNFYKKLAFEESHLVKEFVKFL